MLLSHGLTYMLARGAPAILNFAALAVFTRFLSPGEYGSYTLTIAAVAITDSFLLQWLRLGLLRFLPADRQGRGNILPSVFRIYVIIVAAVSIVTVLALCISWLDNTERKLALLGLVLFIANGSFELTIEKVRSSLSPIRYGAYALTKSGIALLGGTLLAALGYGAAGILASLAFGMIFPQILFGGVRGWLEANRARPDPAVMRSLVVYGFPLAASAALLFIVNSSDRFIIAVLLDTAAAGKYAVGYDLAQFSLGTLLAIVNLAGYPLIVAALENKGMRAAQAELQRTLDLLLIIGLPATTGIALLSSNLATVLVGGAFQAVAITVMPLVAIATLIAGLKSFYLDLAFQLGQDTTKQIWITLATAIINVALNLWWIPIAGIPGAVFATITAYSFAAVMAAVFGRTSFKLPSPSALAWRAGIATLGMLVILWPLREWEGPFVLMVQVGLGVISYGALLFLLGRQYFARRSNL